MTLRWLPALLTLIFLAGHPASVSAAAQIEQQDIHTAPCAAVVGQNSGSVTLNCSGVEPEKVQQILSILNRLVQRQNDLTGLTAKIDEALGALRTMNDRDAKDRQDQEAALVDSIANADRRCPSRVAKTGEDIRAFIANPASPVTGQVIIPTLDLGPVYDTLGGIGGLQNLGTKKPVKADVDLFNDSWASLQHANMDFVTMSGSFNAHIMMSKIPHMGGNQQVQWLIDDRKSLAASLEELTKKYDLVCRMIHRLHGQL